MATAANATVRVPLSSRQWIFLALLVVSVFINYVDRGSLGIAGPMMIRDLNLDPYQFGVVLSAFFWTYAPMQIVAGWLVDRYNVNVVYGIGFLVWSAATLCTGFVGTMIALKFLRTILGFGESVAYPSYSKILVENFKEEHRGIANGLIDAGSKVGPAIGVMLGGLFMAKYGWHVFFWAMGGASLIWLLPWFLYAPRDKIAEGRVKVDQVPLLKLLVVRSAWGNFCGLFCANYVWYFMLNWLPYYFANERHYSLKEVALIGSLPYWAVGASSVLAGWMSDRLIGKGERPVQVRKRLIAMGLLCTCFILPSAMVHDQKISLVLLIIGCVGFGFFSGNHWALSQSLAGPSAAGRWTGWTNAVGNLPGIFGNLFTGWVVKQTGEFYYAFLVCTLLAVAGAYCYYIFIDRTEPVVWQADAVA